MASQLKLNSSVRKPPKILTLNNVDYDVLAANYQKAETELANSYNISDNTTIYIESNVMSSIQIYDILPQEFTSLSTWPQKINLCCWNCTLAFDTVPIFIPELIRQLPFTMRVKGNFCSFGCAITYIFEIYSDKIYVRDNYITNLNILYFIFTGNHPIKILRSPSRINLKKFGGHLSEDQYREEVSVLMESIKHVCKTESPYVRMFENCTKIHDSISKYNCEDDSTATICEDNMLYLPDKSAWFIGDETDEEEDIELQLEDIDEDNI